MADLLSYPGEVPLSYPAGFPGVTDRKVHTGGVTLTLPDREHYRAGEELILEARGSGVVSVMSDLSSSSHQGIFDGEQPISLGAMTSPGVFSCVVSTGNHAESLEVLIAPSGHRESGGQLFYVSVLPVPLSPRAPEVLPLAERLKNGLTPQRLRQALSRVLTEQGDSILGENASGIVGAIAVCTVTSGASIATSGLASSLMGFCTQSLIGAAADVALTLVEFLIDDLTVPSNDAVFTRAEAELIKAAIRAGRFRKGLLDVGAALKKGRRLDVAEKMLGLTGTLVDASSDAGFATGTVAESSRSTIILFRVMKQAERIKLP